jgi:hypothetical protein
MQPHPAAVGDVEHFLQIVMSKSEIMSFTIQSCTH